MSKTAYKTICALAVTGAIAGFSFTSTASAATIGTYTPANFLQSGEVTNSHSSSLIGFIIDLVADAGSPVPGTPVWDTNNGNFVGTPVGNFSNLAPSTTDAYFTVAFLGLNVPTGNSFNYSGLDYDGYDGDASTTGGGNTPLDGSELATLLFADGSSVSANLPAGPAGRPAIGAVLFDSADLVGVKPVDPPTNPPTPPTMPNPVPVPAALPLLATGFGILGILGWRRKRTA